MAGSGRGPHLSGVDGRGALAGRRLRKPLVAAMQGITFTIGIEIALAGDIVVAASDARFCQLEPTRGLAPLGGAAFRVGLVQEVVEPGAQIDRAIALGRELLQCAPTALVHTIANARRALDEDEPAAIAAIPAMAAAVQATDDFREGIASFVEHRAAQFTGR